MGCGGGIDMKNYSSKILILLLVGLFSASLVIFAETPKSEPFGDSHAVRGGQLNLAMSGFPKSFNYYIEKYY